MKPQIGDGVYYGLDSFGKKRASWRVVSFLKRVECTFDPQNKPDDIIELIVHDVISLHLIKEKLSREEKGLPCARRFRYQWCKQDEATHVSLTSVCGCTAPIDKVEIIGPCWDEEKIQQGPMIMKPFFFWVNILIGSGSEKCRIVMLWLLVNRNILSIRLLMAFFRFI